MPLFQSASNNFVGTHPFLSPIGIGPSMVAISIPFFYFWSVTHTDITRNMSDFAHNTSLWYTLL